MGRSMAAGSIIDLAWGGNRVGSVGRANELIGFDSRVLREFYLKYGTGY